MARPLGVERETIVARSDFDDSLAPAMPGGRLGRETGSGRKLAISRLDGIFGEGREDVGEEQLLMLLLVVDPELDQIERGARKVRQFMLERLIHMGAIGANFVQRGTAEHSAAGPRVARPFGLVIAVEQEGIALVESAISWDVITQDEGFAFDAERPRHRVFLTGHELASRKVTNREWREFIDDGGYATPTLWLSEGWDWVQREQVSAPLYWDEKESAFTLAGRREIDWAAPVAHVSFFEADAFARWAGARLPTESEWEDFGAAADPMIGNQLDQARAVLPRPGGGIFGDAWEWTRSAFASYPGFTPAEGAVGEYNGKFMCGQFVLKGASCATPRGHSRASYRNFFPPSARWQFTGLRLARDA